VKFFYVLWKSNKKVLQCQTFSRARRCIFVWQCDGGVTHATRFVAFGDKEIALTESLADQPAGVETGAVRLAE